MKTKITVDLDVFKDLLNNIAENHGDVDTDLDIIKSIVAGWSSVGDRPSLKNIANGLMRIASELIQTHNLLED